MENQIKELVEYITKALVDKPEEITVEIQNDDTISVKLRVGKEDVGKVIGKQGRIAKALRTLLTAVVSKQNKRVSLEIAE